MTMRPHIVRLADYNQWMNAKVYAAAGRLSPEALSADRGAFFGSILATLNHLMVADTVWLKRFAAHPARPAALKAVESLPTPTALNQILFSELAPLQQHREWLDRLIQVWAASLQEADLDQVLDYANMKGVVNRRNVGGLILHFFNHQTHHRGQVTTLLSQAGQDVGPTDLVILVPDEAPPPGDPP